MVEIARVIWDSGESSHNLFWIWGIVHGVLNRRQIDQGVQIQKALDQNWVKHYLERVPWDMFDMDTQALIDTYTVISKVAGRLYVNGEVWDAELLEKSTIVQKELYKRFAELNIEVHQALFKTGDKNTILRANLPEVDIISCSKDRFDEVLEYHLEAARRHPYPERMQQRIPDLQEAWVKIYEFRWWE